MLAQKRSQHRRRRIGSVELHHGWRDEKHRPQATNSLLATRLDAGELAHEIEKAVLHDAQYPAKVASPVLLSVARWTMFTSVHMLTVRRHAGGPAQSERSISDF